MAGRLVLCPTPLGNLEDITLRVLRTLRECDAIFAEDTRVTRALLAHYDIHKPVTSFHERVASVRLRALARLLREDKTVAVVTDAGMPGISDPGIELVTAAREAGAPVDVLPGPSALLGAVVLSGFPLASFRFDGFPPRKARERSDYLASLAGERAAVVWYESPARVRELLQAVAHAYPERRVFVLREYTKKFEQHISGTAAAVVAALSNPPRGEFVVVLDGVRKAAQRSPIGEGVDAALRLLVENGVRPSLAVAALGAATGARRNDLYAHAQAIAARAAGAAGAAPATKR